MTTTTKTPPLSLRLRSEFNGEVVRTRQHVVRTLRGLRGVITDYYRGHGWTLTIAAQDHAAVLTWVAVQLGGHDGDARRWFAELRVGGID